MCKRTFRPISVQFSSVAQSCPTLCDPMDCSTPGLPVHHQPRSLLKSESEAVQSCPTLCNPMDCSPPGFSVHGIFQARILEWVASSFSKGSSWPRDRTQVSRIAGRRFNLWATIELVMPSNYLILCHPLLFPPSIFSSIRVFSNESAVRIR